MQEAVITTSTQVVTGPGQMYKISITTPGSGASTVNVYDGIGTSSKVLFSGDGVSEMNYDLAEQTAGIKFFTGLYVALAGTTKPTVVVTYD